MEWWQVVELIAECCVAVGTIAAFFAALCDIKKNKKQFDIERKERLDLEEKKQASNVAVWSESDRLPSVPISFDTKSYVPQPVLITNANETPIYNAIVSVVGRYGAGPRECGEDNDSDYPCRLLFQEIPHGTWGQMIPTNGPGMHVSTGLEIAFSDSAGKSWIRRGNGALEHIPSSPLDYYGINMPCEWSNLCRIE